MEQKFRSRQD